MSSARTEAADQTRARLLEAAFAEIHRNGFRGASLDAILRETGVTKGALYYHFKSKAELGYAVVDEIIRPFVEANWKPVMQADNIIDGAIAILHARVAERSQIALTLGCPFNNLIQEMSPVDAGFRERLHTLLEEWRAGVAAGMRLGQQRGQVRKDVDPQETADFIVSAIEGCVGMAKAASCATFYQGGMRGLEQYLNQLRA
ncbi:MAG: TetR family transcriptional regulator C-terminal domain-containing protein [Oceanococcaceae bacterium]